MDGHWHPQGSVGVLRVIVRQSTNECRREGGRELGEGGVGREAYVERMRGEKEEEEGDERWNGTQRKGMKRGDYDGT